MFLFLCFVFFVFCLIIMLFLLGFGGGKGWTLLVGEVCSCSEGTAFDYDDG